MASIPRIEINRVLEWDKLLILAQKEARTEPGKALLSALENSTRWASDLASAKLLQLETQEITLLLDRDALWGPLSDLVDPEKTLERLAKGSVLETEELATIRRWLYAVDTWIQTPRDEIRGERFKKTLTHLPDPFNVLRILDSVLTPDGELSEKASPKLGSLYSEIRSLRREIDQILDQLQKNFSQKGVLQENYTDVRDGRYVLPVKISHQNEIDGIIYEASASRQTVFIEPREVAALNNRLRQRQNELLQETFRILQETSQKIHPFVPEISLSVEALSYWDAVQAKARLGRHYAGKSIEVVENRYFSLKQTAHPLLWWSLEPATIIRNEIEFGNPAKTLLITGPNTGGKTVLLKTLGLAGVCARTGFPFPATDHPQVPFFDHFFADLGDPQSIEHHLSSFSGHVLRFKEILELLTDRSLILIDELNSATDPEEGAALGRAVLETIMSKNAMIVTTTHDPHLKALAVSDSRILNSSMAFDESARTPTYRMVVGVPGRSRALETADRLGIPQEVIQLAKNYLSKEHIEFESTLAKLDHDVQEAARARREAVALREEAERMKREWTERTESSVNDMMDRTRQKLRRILEQAQDEVRSSVKKLDEMRSRKEIDSTRSTLNQAFTVAASKIESALEQEAPEIANILPKKSKANLPTEVHASQIQAGMTVKIPKWKNSGTVLEVSGNKVKVAMGTLQMTLGMNEVEPVASSKPAQVQLRVASSYTSSSEPASRLDLRGERFEVAMASLEQYLDETYRTGSMAEVTIVHGLGTGALREGTLHLLRKLPYVKTFRDGGTGHGGTGATIVEFDRD
jgi:DNA mismatch repair protein MutS2